MSIRDEINRMRDGGGGEWDYLEQADGSRFWYRPEKDVPFGFGLYWLDCMSKDPVREERLPTPPLIHAVAGAVDREAAMLKLFPEWKTRPPKCAFDLAHLIKDGEVVPDLWAWGMADTWDDEEEEYGESTDTYIER